MALIVFSTFLFAFTIGLAMFRGMLRDRELLARRLEKYTKSLRQKRREEEDILNRPFSERVVRPVIAQLSLALARLTPSRNRRKLQQVLQQAGNPGGLKAHEFMALQYMFALILMLGAWLFAWLARKGPGGQVFFTVSAGVCASLAGRAYLNSRVRKRKAIIQKELPDAMDLLTVSVEAGLGFDAALMQVVDKFKGVLAGEFRITLQELRMGRSRREALKDMSSRTGVEDLQAFVGAMIQADQLGVPITRILRAQSEQIRAKRRQRVEEKAMKAPVKMLFPLVFFIFPSIFIVLLGPAALKIFSFLANRF
ncbi:MAG: type II secretion system F family protein [Peptococcaceae bacterium]|jgi:tight adherence protein C|nr:type II secretion system F family protein [Peptococcaceae bacterium]MDH7524793.1 type II secretion system F family protein [Peptococcaceae bacterium]